MAIAVSKFQSNGVFCYMLFPDDKLHLDCSRFYLLKEFDIAFLSTSLKTFK